MIKDELKDPPRTAYTLHDAGTAERFSCDDCGDHTEGPHYHNWGHPPVGAICPSCYAKHPATADEPEATEPETLPEVWPKFAVWEQPGSSCVAVIRAVNAEDSPAHRGTMPAHEFEGTWAGALSSDYREVTEPQARAYASEHGIEWPKTWGEEPDPDAEGWPKFAVGRGLGAQVSRTTDGLTYEYIEAGEDQAVCKASATWTSLLTWSKEVTKGQARAYAFEHDIDWPDEWGEEPDPDAEGWPKFAVDNGYVHRAVDADTRCSLALPEGGFVAESLYHWSAYLAKHECTEAHAREVLAARGQDWPKTWGEEPSGISGELPAEPEPKEGDRARVRVTKALHWHSVLGEEWEATWEQSLSCGHGWFWFVDPPGPTRRFLEKGDCKVIRWGEPEPAEALEPQCDGCLSWSGCRCRDGHSLESSPCRHRTTAPPKPSEPEPLTEYFAPTMSATGANGIWAVCGDEVTWYSDESPGGTPPCGITADKLRRMNPPVTSQAAEMSLKRWRTPEPAEAAQPSEPQPVGYSCKTCGGMMIEHAGYNTWTCPSCRKSWLSHDNGRAYEPFLWVQPGPLPGPWQEDKTPEGELLEWTGEFRNAEDGEWLVSLVDSMRHHATQSLGGTTPLHRFRIFEVHGNCWYARWIAELRQGGSRRKSPE